ncbi:hypothetical protein L6452_00911 [Arctium lappa]|uniref:Uncharacterized protein n=1 Tax=Arctium lappa TaxID=4217 RepID=A0ACB9FFU4_ARCLA|nr:hypothetical protein L6452_00911 [Arctium lappa]
MQRSDHHHCFHLIRFSRIRLEAHIDFILDAKHKTSSERRTVESSIGGQDCGPAEKQNVGLEALAESLNIPGFPSFASGPVPRCGQYFSSLRRRSELAVSS